MRKDIKCVKCKERLLCNRIIIIGLVVGIRVILKITVKYVINHNLIFIRQFHICRGSFNINNSIFFHESKQINDQISSNNKSNGTVGICSNRTLLCLCLNASTRAE